MISSPQSGQCPGRERRADFLFQHRFQALNYEIFDRCSPFGRGNLGAFENVRWKVALPDLGSSTPAVWDEMFTIVPSPRFGLNLDPSHLVWLRIDYLRVVRDYASRILHVHAKDMEIDRDGLYRNGTVSLGMGWQVPRLPGLGEVRWDRFLAALYGVGYDGVVSVEHEDRAFEGTAELVQRGFLIARDALRPYLH